MKTDLLLTKLYIPAPRLDFVPRRRLFEDLAAGLGGKLTLVSAPAGFGKTTVVSEWVRDCGCPTAWLSLDKHDNDLARFLFYLVAALQRIDPQMGVVVQAALEESRSPNFEALMTRLVSELGRLPAKCILVLDDYHLIDSKPVHDVINFLIEYLPPTLHLVISGRSDPPLPVSRLRVQGEVNEVRTSKLRFTNQEAAAYLNERMGFDLSPANIAALEARTEGWIASLKLAALSMQGRDDWPEFIAKFSGSNRYVIDYLIDEVMRRQTEEVQTFLRRSSILDRFCADLCRYVVGGNEQIDIIHYLDRADLFLIPLDDHKEWYRYHHLFADFLNQRLRESEPDLIPELHRRASQWFEDQGLVDEAIQHALAGGDLESAARLVDALAFDLVVRRESNKLLKYIEQLPPGLVQGYPILGIGHAWALLFMGQLDRVEPALIAAESNQESAPGIPISGYATTIRAYLANLEGDLIGSIRLSEQALEELPPDSPDRFTLINRGAAVIWLGVNHRQLGDLERAEQLFTDAAGLNQKGGNVYAALSSFEQLAELGVLSGQLQRALECYQSGLKVAQNWDGMGGRPQGTLIAAAGLHLGLGTILYQMNNLEEAATHIQEGAYLLELGELWTSMHAYRMLAYLRQAQGDFQASAELLSKALAIEESLHLPRPNTSDLPSLAQLGILLSRLMPDRTYLLAEASRKFEKLGVQANDEVDFTSPEGFPHEVLYSDLARLLIAQGRAAEALPLLRRLLEAAITMERGGDELRYRVLIALAGFALGDSRTALDSLEQALSLAEPQGYVRLFVDEGMPMWELLRLAVAQDIAPAYTYKLLAAFPAYLSGTGPIEKELPAHPQPLVEPLSEREIEVLHLMAEGYRYKEIADRLVVSINTVRHHTRNVYSKLEANNRTQAVARAKALHIL